MTMKSITGSVPDVGYCRFCMPLAISAALTLATCAVNADTVAWYHLDELAPGQRLSADTTILNAVDSAKLSGSVHSVSGSTLGSDENFLPFSTNDVIDTVSVVDPVGGTTNRNPRSLFFVHADSVDGNNPSRRGGCIMIASDESLSLANVTVEFFVKPVRQCSEDGMQLVAKRQTANNRFTYSICLTKAGKPYVNVFDSTSTLVNTTGDTKFVGSESIIDGKWHHLAFTVNGTTAKLYVDGVLASTAALTESLFYVNDGPLFIGASRMGYFTAGGLIDEVRISNTALTPESFLRYENMAATQFHADLDGNAIVETAYFTAVGTFAPDPSTGSNPSYDASEVPNYRIADGYNNTLRKHNTSSLRFAKSTVKFPHIPDLEMPEMTVEFFMKHESADDWAGLLRFSQSNSNWGATPIWNIGYNNSSLLNIRVDTTEASNRIKTFGGSFFDGNWHHVAITFQQGESKLTVRVYDNYNQVGDDWEIDGALNYSNGSCLAVGKGGFSGWIDEVRISRGVLPVELFMRARPSPGLSIIVK